jgi:hypothetical protein
MPKIECKLEDWWINSSLHVTDNPDNPCTLYGDIYGHPDYNEGKFVTLVLLKADFTTMVAETADAYIKLGVAQSLDGILKKGER